MKPALLAGKRIVVSQPVGTADTFAQALKGYGADVCVVSSVRIARLPSGEKARKALRELATFDWVVFTSAKAVSLFMERVREMHGVSASLRVQKVAAVGPTTAAAARKLGLPVRFVPKTNTAKALAESLDGVQGKRILLPRASVASADLPRILKQRGARVTDLAIYATELDARRDSALEKLALGKKIDYLIFTSPSTVSGLIAKVRGAAARKAIAVVPVVAIGPVTAAKAKVQGFKKVTIALTHTRAGILRTLRKIELLKS